MNTSLHHLDQSKSVKALDGTLPKCDDAGVIILANQVESGSDLIQFLLRNSKSGPILIDTKNLENPRNPPNYKTFCLDRDLDEVTIRLELIYRFDFWHA